jgi:hypothetical protein
VRRSLTAVEYTEVSFFTNFFEFEFLNTKGAVLYEVTDNISTIHTSFTVLLVSTIHTFNDSTDFHTFP